MSGFFVLYRQFYTPIVINLLKHLGRGKLFGSSVDTAKLRCVTNWLLRKTKRISPLVLYLPSPTFPQPPINPSTNPFSNYIATMKEEENLVGYIKSHDDKEIEKGFRLFTERTEDILIHPKKKTIYTIDVPSESTDDSYEVKMNVLSNDVIDKCKCVAYKKYGQCKHAIAAALALLWEEHDYTEEDLEVIIEADIGDALKFKTSNGPSDKTDSKTSGAKKSEVKKRQPQSPSPPIENAWKELIKKGIFTPGDFDKYSGYYWRSYGELNKQTLISFKQNELHWSFLFKEKKVQFSSEIKYDAGDIYYYRCTCNFKSIYDMCQHVRLAFDKLLYINGNDFFLKFKDYTQEKNNLLQRYGLTIADEDAKAFTFSLSLYGELLMQSPSAFIGEGDKERLKSLNRLFKSKDGAESVVMNRPKPLTDTIIDFETAFLFNNNSQRLKLGFELEAIKLYQKPGRTDLKKLSINQPQNLALFKGLNDELYGLLLQLSDKSLLDYLQSKGEGYIKNYSNPWQQLSESTSNVLRKHYIECLQKLWPLLAKGFQTFLLNEGKFSSNNCKPVTLGKGTVEFTFDVSADDRFIAIRLHPVIDDVPVEGQIQILHGFVFNIGNQLFLLKNTDDLPVLEQFKNGFIKVAIGAKYDAIQNIIAPLQERYKVQLPESFEIKTIDITPQPQVLLKELNNQYLMLQPQFLYEELLVDYNSNPEDIITTLNDGSLQIMKRHAAVEKQFFESLRGLHNTFERQWQNDFFYVHFNEVMKGNWFLNTVRFLQANNFTVKGMQELKRFRYNTSKPNWEMKTGSGIDWFDLQITVSFGDQQVPLKEIRKALLNKQNIVVLGDGTFGVLPEEWLQQYGLLLKMSDEQTDGSLRLSKLHYTIIDDLHNQIDNEAVLLEIETKKQKLLEIETIQTTAISKHIKAKLRPYQQSGFQWLQTLDELGWGGCLADDMGLGKTLQAIAFLQCMKEKCKGSTHLVVCPTSLIYNWETELNKFAPKLKYHIYYGAGRSFTDEHFESFDIVITSYGLVRNDMEELLKFQWHYVILDESQAIKNPDAQTTKAVQLLKSKNRLILSGTPVQNNTYDLYAQFNFLNAGLLGNKEFYKKEFANPIDKYNDADKSKQLRRLVYPFLLRRTKEEVAKDLPDKTETILWCQLPTEQRRVYEDYKNYYRTMVMKKIEEEGMGKAGMYVLEGLLRLRQICDSPELVKDAEVTTKKSIKTEELLREIEENTGKHKLLVFSQFTEMLSIIKTALEKKNISYCYLDGSTPAEKRKQQVDGFQADESIKIFLISLKAGGVGLNLTAADYVYIVDPWWNPAVEQQAIDRTHRIGQTKKVFAYKMICKDTVEEKIVQLQQRKKQLANDLVTEDAGFIKKLTKDDVQFLFS